MRNLPRAIIPILRKFELLFSERVWEWAKILLIGTILAPGKRTVTAALRVMGLSDDAQFQNYHRVLNRAVWSPYAASRILLRLHVDTLHRKWRPPYGMSVLHSVHLSHVSAIGPRVSQRRRPAVEARRRPAVRHGRERCDARRVPRRVAQAEDVRDGLHEGVRRRGRPLLQDAVRSPRRAQKAVLSF